MRISTLATLIYAKSQCTVCAVSAGIEIAAFYGVHRVGGGRGFTLPSA